MAGGNNRWERKRAWFKRKFERKFEESIQQAIPQIAIQVAEILKATAGTSEKIDLEEVVKKIEPVVHKNYVCDGCGVTPIVGVCYKSSVVPNFDFCAQCEATKDHPYPFLKLKTPEQRPHALITVLKDEPESDVKITRAKEQPYKYRCPHTPEVVPETMEMDIEKKVVAHETMTT